MVAPAAQPPAPAPNPMLKWRKAVTLLSTVCLLAVTAYLLLYEIPALKTASVCTHWMAGHRDFVTAFYMNWTTADWGQPIGGGPSGSPGPAGASPSILLNLTVPNTTPYKVQP